MATSAGRTLLTSSDHMSRVSRFPTGSCTRTAAERGEFSPTVPLLAEVDGFISNKSNHSINALTQIN